MKKKRILHALLFFFILTMPGCRDHQDTLQMMNSEKSALIVDTDMGLDDVRAILALLADSTIDIKGILTVEGSAATGKATDNLIGLLEVNHVAPVPVFKGFSSPELPPPLWRGQANNLAGSTFPPPRNLSAIKLTPDVADELIHRSNNITYLALGPLVNLAMITRECPDALNHIKNILIPAKVSENSLENWNLLYDVHSAQQVFSSGRNIRIVDISGLQKREFVDLLSTLPGSSRSVQWILSTIGNDNQDAKHFFLYDEIVSAVVLRPELFEMSTQKYFCRFSENKPFDLVPDSEGNISILRIKDLPELFALLKRQWQRGTIPGSPVNHEPIVPVRNLLRTFHGHLGPYVVLGYRMGKLALDELKSEGHFGLSVEVHSILSPPFSCLIDGVQLGSGCTLGKRNIQIQGCDGPGWAVFTKNSGEKKVIRLRPEIAALVKKNVDEKGVEEAGEELLAMALSELFIVE